MNIYQLTEEDVYRSSTLEPEDAGKWITVINGCYYGFWESREEALTKVRELQELI